MRKKGLGLELGLGLGECLAADFDVTVGVDLLADEAQGGFEVARGGLEGVGIDGQRGAEDDERGAVFRATDRLLEGEAADGLDGDVDRLDDFTELVHRAGHAEAAGGDAPAFVVADVASHKRNINSFRKKKMGICPSFFVLPEPPVMDKR